MAEVGLLDDVLGLDLQQADQRLQRLGLVAKDEDLGLATCLLSPVILDITRIW